MQWQWWSAQAFWHSCSHWQGWGPSATLLPQLPHYGKATRESCRTSWDCFAGSHLVSSFRDSMWGVLHGVSTALCREKEEGGKKTRKTPKGEQKSYCKYHSEKCSRELESSRAPSLSCILPPASSLMLSDFQCAICLHIVDRPIETPCKKVLCADCISTTLLRDDNPTELEVHCPSCKECHSLAALLSLQHLSLFSSFLEGY